MPTLQSCHTIINLDNLSHNLKTIQSYNPKAQVVAMVKANAYGHGLVEIAKHLNQLDVKYFGVATADEGEQLRKAKITGQILVMAGSGCTQELNKIYQAHLTPLLSSEAELQDLITFAKNKKVKSPLLFHLDLDTGMSRAGLVIDENPSSQLAPIVSLINNNKQLVKLDGVSTHFANAEKASCAFSKKQLKRFGSAIKFLNKNGFDEIKVHFSKSSAIITQLGDSDLALQKLLQNHPILIRPGLSLYGINPLSTKLKKPLKPILSWKAPITLRKTLKIGDCVGYNNTWKVKRKTELALIRVGYGDGYSRLLSNQGQVLIHGIKAPVIGRVSMDLITVDVTDVVKKLGEKSCAVKTLVTLLGKENKQEITATDLAKQCQTIPYEILTNISSRVDRIYN
ncbi:MAG: alanine racemase [bacterium]|nr:alanine racemase [bacterium]